MKKIISVIKSYRLNPNKDKNLRLFIEIIFGIYFYIKNIKNFILLKKISNEIKKSNNKKKQKIFFAFSFNISANCFFHDFYLSKSLELENCEIIPLILGKKLYLNNNKIFNKYLDHPHEIAGFFLKFNDILLWKYLCGFNPISLDENLSQEDFSKYSKITEDINIDAIDNFNFENLPAGKYARLRFINDNGVGDFRLVNEYKKKLKIYLLHTILIIIATKKILKLKKPDIVLTNDTFYYPPCIIQDLCKNLNIPTYNYFWGIKNNSFFYSKDKSCQWRDISNILEFNKNNSELSDTESKIIDQYLNERPSGNTAFSAQFENPGLNNDIIIDDENLLIKKMDLNKPTAILFANVSNDLNALERSIQFDDQFDWIEKCIDYFNVNQNYNLIIKPHPAEKNKHSVPVIQSIKSHINNKKIKLEQNIIVLDPLTSVSSYKLYKIAKICLVYTSTTGLEYACNGYPVITSGKSHYHGKGFTIDTNTLDDYFLAIENYLMSNESETDIAFRIKKAKRYYYYYAFVFAKSFEPLTYDKFKIKLNFKSVEDFKNNRNINLNNICDSIISKKDII